MLMGDDMERAVIELLMLDELTSCINCACIASIAILSCNSPFPVEVCPAWPGCCWVELRPSRLSNSCSDKSDWLRTCKEKQTPVKSFVHHDDDQVNVSRARSVGGGTFWTQHKTAHGTRRLQRQGRAVIFFEKGRGGVSAQEDDVDNGSHEPFCSWNSTAEKSYLSFFAES